MIDAFAVSILYLMPAGPVLLLCWLLWRAAVLRCGLHGLVLGLSLFHQLLLITFPIYYDLFTHFELERELVIEVNPGLLAKVMTGEFVYILGFSVVLFFSMRKRKVPRAPSLRDLRAVTIYTGFLLVLGIVIYTEQFFTTPVIEYESYKHFAEPKTGLGLAEMIYGWLKGAFALPCLFAACLLVSNRGQSRMVRWSSLAIIVLMLMFGIATGYRGRITWVISLLLVGSVINRNRTALISAFGLLIFTVSVAQFMGGVWRSISINDLAGQSQWAAITRLVQEASGKGDAASEQSEIVRTMARRAQGPRNSAVLYVLQDRGSGGGVRPLTSAIATIVPRAVWPDKGIGGSSDETPYGAAIFLVRHVGYDSPLFNMGPILASAHAYWEGGWIWLGACGLLSGAVWSVVLALAYRLPILLGRIISLSFASSLLIDGLFTMFNPLYTYILVTINSVVFIYGLFILLKVWCRLKFTLRGSEGGMRSQRDVVPDIEVGNSHSTST